MAYGLMVFTGFFVAVVVADRLPVQRLEELLLRVLQDVRRLQVQLKKMDEWIAYNALQLSRFHLKET